MPLLRNDTRARQRLLPAVASLWVLGIAVGLGIMMNYDAAPGSPGRPASQWPAGSAIELSTDRMTLVMRAHPRCPCTRASLGELELIQARCADRLRTYVLFLSPQEKDEHWSETDTWERASSIPEVHVRKDAEGKQARLFHVLTSGHTLLYDRRSASVQRRHHRCSRPRWGQCGARCDRRVDRAKATCHPFDLSVWLLARRPRRVC